MHRRTAARAGLYTQQVDDAFDLIDFPAVAPESPAVDEGHHHPRSPSLREELKPFDDISNLEQVRAPFRGSRVDVVIHGHKHEHAAYFDHIYADGHQAHRTLVISGATFEVGREQDAMRLITIDGLPHIPCVKIQPLPLSRAGAEWQPGAPIERRLWVQAGKPADPVMITPGAPVTIEGSDIDEVYARACAVASTDAAELSSIFGDGLKDQAAAVWV